MNDTPATAPQPDLEPAPDGLSWLSNRGWRPPEPSRYEQAIAEIPDAALYAESHYAD